jgi:hypothetical protein
MKGEQIDDGRLLNSTECRDFAAVLLRAADRLDALPSQRLLRAFS